MERQEQARKSALKALAMNVGKEFPEPLLNMWLKLVEPYPDEVVCEAVMGVIREYEYKTIPNFAVLQRHLDRLAGAVPEEKRTAMEAEAEWQNLLEAIRKNGAYNEPELHPTTEYALRCLGGWSAACAWETAHLKWHRKDFVDIWKDAHGHVEEMSMGAEGLESALGASEPLKSLKAAEPEGTGEDDEESSLSPGM